MSYPNRRKHARVKPKQLATRVRAGQELHIGLGIEDISMGGVFVRCNTPLKVGRVVTLELLRPGASQPIAIAGKVTTAVSPSQGQQLGRSAGMGIQFDALPPHLHQRLEGLIGAIDPTAVRIPTPANAAVRKPASPSYSFKSADPAALQKEIDTLKTELTARNRKIEELLAENKTLWQKIRTLDV
jgi:Tfp pilus assembly protein PilZ